MGCAAQFEIEFDTVNDLSNSRFSDEEARKDLEELLEDRGVQLPKDMQMDDGASKSEDILPVQANLTYHPRRLVDEDAAGDGESHWNLHLLGAHRRMKDGRHRVFMFVEDIKCYGRLSFPSVWKGERPKGTKSDRAETWRGQKPGEGFSES